MKRRPIVSEAKLRRIIREELTRQYLLEEGFLDVLKAPFQKIGEKAKAEIASRTEEALAKITKMVETLKSGGPMGEVNQFLSALSQEKMGGSPQDIVSQVPELAELSNDIEEIKTLDPKELLASGPQVAAEAFTRHQLVSHVILLDEQREQSLEAYGKSQESLNESIVLTALSAWWTFEKTVVGGLGILYWCLKFLSWVTDKFGFKNASKVLKVKADKVHHLEDAIIETTVFPAPLQYAAYAAYKKMKSEKPLTYDQFNDPKNKEAKASKKETFRILKFALLAPMLVDAMIGLGQALSSTFQSIGDFAKTAKYSAKVASETGAVSKLSSAAAAAGELGTAAGDVGSAALSAAKRA